VTKRGRTPIRRGAAFRVSWPRFRIRSVTSRTKSCVHTRLLSRWHDLETFLLRRVEHVLGPSGVAANQTPYLDTISRRRNPLEPIRGMQRPPTLRCDHALQHLSPFTFHLSRAGGASPYRPPRSIRGLPNPSLFAPDNQQRRNQSDGGCRGHPKARHGLIAGCFNQRFADGWGKSAE
jgi:hypothetical protein